MDFNSLVVTTDLSEPSLAVFDIAAHEAKMRGAVIHLVNVLEVSHSPVYAHTIHYQELYTGLTEESRKSTEQALNHFAKEYFHDQKINVAVLSSTVSVGKKIAEYAEDCDASGILIASGGKGYIDDVFLGSTVQRVLQHAICPVIVVPPQNDTATAQTSKDCGLNNNRGLNDG